MSKRKKRGDFIQLRRDGRVKNISQQEFLCLRQQGKIKDFQPNARSKVGTQIATCFNKKSYSSLDEAIDFSQFILNKYGDSQRPYECPHCRRYHLTSNAT